VLAQSYRKIEIILVDDGSTDNTKSVATKYDGLKYVYQSNQGLSAARNKGIDNSNGDYLVFLDADDFLLQGAIAINLEYMRQDKHSAFVSGGFKFLGKEMFNGSKRVVEADHFNHFLQGNFIIMHGAVMFRKWVFDSFRYDTSLKACEDHDLYLKITRKHSVIHHTQPIAIYRIHSTNMSGNPHLMLESILTVLHRQESLLRDERERNNLKKGLQYYRKLYGLPLYFDILNKNVDEDIKNKSLHTLWKYNRSLYFKYQLMKPLSPMIRFIKDTASTLVLRQLHKVGMYKTFLPKRGKVHKGDFNRVIPFNTDFGYSRGGPVDRYYIENFLGKNESCIKGRVLEIGDNDYTIRFGKTNVTKSDVLHVNEDNEKATFVGDLSNAPEIQDNTFDCIILTQTLHLIYEYKDALKTCERILKPGGTLLLTVPGITHIDQGEWKNYWLWSFTEASITRIFLEVFPVHTTVVETHGNVLVATAFLYGMGLKEIRKEDMDFVDPHYQVIITAKAVKPQ
ncbi:MAG: glycosyltransferase, partial [Chitinophagaceae bacterium]